MISALGRQVIEQMKWAQGVFTLFFSIFYWMSPKRQSQGKSLSHQNIVGQMVFVGLRSVVIVFFVAMFTGIVLAMQTAYQLERMGAVLYVATIVAVSSCRELVPVLTALVVAGRAGSAIAAELGTMKVTEQIEALDTMAISPVRFLVVPRFWALFVMLPALTIMGNVSAILGGFIVGTVNLHINPDLYMQATFKYLELKDIYTGLAKAFIFAMIIALVSCFEGLNSRGGAEGVGRSTTRSVVISFILIILSDCVVTAIFYFSKI